MSNLVLFQKHLLANNVQGIQEFLSDLKRESANEGLRQAGEAFGFPTAAVDGIRYMLGRDLAWVGYKRAHTGSLQDLLKQYGRKLLSLSSFPDHQGSLIRQVFSLSPQDFSSTLATWGDILIVGMKGETETARKIMAYLLEAEEKARVAQACESITGLSPHQFQVGSEDPILQALTQAQQLRIRQIETEKTLAVHDRALADQGKKIRAIADCQKEELLLTPEQERTLVSLMERLKTARAAARKISIEEASRALYPQVKQKLGIRTFRAISQAEYLMALEFFQTQIAREEAILGQGALRLVTGSRPDLRRKK